MAKHNAPPKYLNLLRIQMPVGAVLSIAHRISGVFLFLSLPFVVYLLGLSLQDASGFEQARGWLVNPLVQVLLLPLVWSVFHHLLAGFRHLLLDVHIGVEKPCARMSAWVVNIAALLLVCAYFLGVLL